MHAPSCAFSQASWWGPPCPDCVKPWPPLVSEIYPQTQNPACISGGDTFHLTVFSVWLPVYMFQKRNIFTKSIHLLSHLARLHPCGAVYCFFLKQVFLTCSASNFIHSLEIVSKLSQYDLTLPVKDYYLNPGFSFYLHCKLVKRVSLFYYFLLQIYPWRIWNSYNKNTHIYNNILKYLQAVLRTTTWFYYSNFWKLDISTQKDTCLVWKGKDSSVVFHKTREYQRKSHLGRYLVQPPSSMNE